MGYYVNLTESNVYVPKDKVQEAYEALCALNDKDDVNGHKTGGRWERDKDGNVTMTARWFAWMDENYPETCSNLVEVLQQVGFEVSDHELGVFIDHYDNKTGCEQLFMATLAPYLVAGTDDVPYMNWRGEDGELYRWEFRDGKMWELSSTIVWDHMVPVYV